MADTAASKKIFDARYEILSIIGRGSCSVVYHARHVDAPHAEVALKVLLNRRELLARGQSLADSLRQEALALVSSRHRYVVRLDDFHSVGDLCYLSLEFAPLLDLRKLIASREGKLPAVQVERFMTQAAEALAYLHKAGIIHRDLKPDNILVMNEREIRLADFGVAVLPGDLSDLEDLRRGVGTMDYMAPEVLDGTRYDERSDVYALGVTFYEVASGIHPFDDAPLAEQLSRRRDGNFADIRALNPEVSPALAAIIMRAMSYDADARFGSGRELHQALQDLREVRPTETLSATSALGAGQVFSAPGSFGGAPVDATALAASAAQGSPGGLAAPMDYSSELPRSVQDLLDALERELPPETNGQDHRSEQDALLDDDYRDDFLEDLSDGDFDDEQVVSNPANGPITEEQVGQKEATTESSPEELNLAEGTVQDLPKVETASETNPVPSAPDDEPPLVEATPSHVPLPMEESKAAPEPATEPTIVAAETHSGTVPEPSPVSQPQPAADPVPAPPARRPAFTALIALALIPLLVFIFFRIRGASENTLVATPVALRFEGFPSYSGGALTFPTLPTGTYVGSIHGLFPGLTVPLVLIADQQRNELTFVLGLEGTRPVTLSLDPNAPRGPTRVATAGLMLSFSGEELNGEIIGYVQEATTGVEAEWRAVPNRPAPAIKQARKEE